MRRYLIIFFFALTNSLFAQWTQVGSQTWDDGPPHVLIADTHYVYAGGGFNVIDTDSVGQIAKWDGTSWSRLGSGIKGGVYSLFFHNGNLYAGGIFDTAGNVPARNIAMWNGTAWSSLGAGVNSYVEAICFYNGELYVGGSFDSAGSVSAKYIARWNGATWSPVGNGMSNYIADLDTFQGHLYAGGGFTLADGDTVNYIAKWNGTNWSSLGSGTSSAVKLLTINENFLFAGGLFTDAGGVTVNGIAAWDGNSWHNVPGWISNTTALCNDTAGNIYAGSYLTFEAYRWDGTNWYIVCPNGSSLLNGTATSLVFFKGELYAGGYSNGIPVSKCADPTGPMGVTMFEKEEMVKIIPNPIADQSVLQLKDASRAEILIYDLTGRKIFKEFFNHEIILSKEDFVTEGVYFYDIKTSGNNYYGKILVQ